MFEVFSLTYVCMQLPLSFKIFGKLYLHNSRTRNIPFQSYKRIEENVIFIMLTSLYWTEYRIQHQQINPSKFKRNKSSNLKSIAVIFKFSLRLKYLIFTKDLKQVGIICNTTSNFFQPLREYYHGTEIMNFNSYWFENFNLLCSRD